jgi:iron complex transport system substrate-binding protein
LIRKPYQLKPRRAAQNIVVEPIGRIARISEERLDEVVGDILFIMVHRDRDKQFLAELRQKPIWKTLKAVQEKQVYPVDTLAWVGSNLIAADAVLDDLEKYLVNMP